MARSCASPAPNSSERSSPPARSSLERDEQGNRRPRGIMRSQVLPLAKVRFLSVASASELCASVPNRWSQLPWEARSATCAMLRAHSHVSAEWRNRSLRVTTCNERSAHPHGSAALPQRLRSGSATPLARANIRVGLRPKRRSGEQPEALGRRDRLHPAVRVQFSEHAPQVVANRLSGER